MKQTNFIWHPVVGEREIVPKDKPTGLKVIPGCERKTDGTYPAGVLFRGKRYLRYAISPFGAIILGTDGTYSQTLSRDNLLPETDNPVIAPMAEFLQVHA